MCSSEYISVDGDDDFTIEIKKIDEKMYDIYVIYMDERHRLGTCYSEIYGNAGYDELVYNEYGAAIVRTFDGKSTVFCVFNSNMNRYIDNQLMAKIFYTLNFSNYGPNTLIRRF